MERVLKKIGPWTEEESCKVDPILTRTVCPKEVHVADTAFSFINYSVW